MTDWQSIKQEYEQGISQRSLATKYDISQASISRHASREGWCISDRIIPSSLMQRDTPSTPNENKTVIDIAHTLLTKMAEHVEGFLETKDIKLLADALSQIHKIELATSSDKPTASGLPAELLPYATLDELASIESILHTIEARKLEAEGIRTIGKR